MHLNGLYELRFDAAALAPGLVDVDLLPHQVSRLNAIQYNPVGRAGSATVNVLVR